MNDQKTFHGINSFTLHLLAMFLMLCDHLWACSFLPYDFFAWLGRIAYPIFAFMIIEGYFHTHNFKKYALRMLLWALISEIPFNLMSVSSPIYPFHQNVLWTFLIGLLAIRLIEKVRAKGKLLLTVLCFIAVTAVAYLLGFVLFVDYFGYGILMIMVFYLFRQRKWWCFVAQAVCLFYINWEMISGLSFPIEIFGREIYIVQQGIACLALIPIWFYNGKQGPHNKAVQYCFYAFYPVHMLLLSLPRLLW